MEEGANDGVNEGVGENDGVDVGENEGVEEGANDGVNEGIDVGENEGATASQGVYVKPRRLVSKRNSVLIQVKAPNTKRVSENIPTQYTKGDSRYKYESGDHRNVTSFNIMSRGKNVVFDAKHPSESRIDGTSTLFCGNMF